MNHGSKVTHVPSTIDLILNRLLNQHISSSGSGSNFGGPISELYALSLRAWSHDTAHGPNASDAAQKFLSIVQHMQHEYESTGDLTVKPESYHFPSLQRQIYSGVEEEKRITELQLDNASLRGTNEHLTDQFPQCRNQLLSLKESSVVLE